MEVKNTSHALKAANGTEIAVTNKVCLPFTLGKYEGVIKGLVTEHVAGIILEIGWLVQHCAVWEFSRSRVKIGGMYHKLCQVVLDRIQFSWCRPLVCV